VISGTLGYVGVTIRHVMGLMARLIEIGLMEGCIECAWEEKGIEGQMDGRMGL
jgi:hypothetical protein